jgi:hypothetical protein
MLGEHMKTAYIMFGLIALVLLASGVSAYSGFNRYYYTDNYVPSVYYPSPAYVPAYSYPVYTYNTTYYRTPTYYYPTYYPTYTYVAPVVYSAPATYSGMSFYTSNNGWGFSINRGSVCGYYGYC